MEIMTNQKYRLKEFTAEVDRCIVGGCPGVYELKDITPEGERCVFGACPSIYEVKESYFIVGQVVNPSDFGLEGKVGEGEALVMIPKKVVDRK